MSSDDKPETQVDRFRKVHPWLFCWESWKLAVSEFIWSFHHRRNRWCDRCGQCIGNTRKAAAAHRCCEVKKES